ncbi:MAG: hypothetical protein ACKESB_03765 [Candidatus Hodgkinia cicadicola]
MVPKLQSWASNGLDVPVVGIADSSADVRGIDYVVAASMVCSRSHSLSSIVKTHLPSNCFREDFKAAFLGATDNCVNLAAEAVEARSHVKRSLDIKLAFGSLYGPEAADIYIANQHNMVAETADGGCLRLVKLTKGLEVVLGLVVGKLTLWIHFQNTVR